MFVKCEYAFMRLEFEMKPQYEVAIFEAESGVWVKSCQFFTRRGAVSFAKSVCEQWVEADRIPFDWFVFKQGTCIDCGSVVLGTFIKPLHRK